MHLFLRYTMEANLLSDSANCTVLCAVILIQYQRVTDRQTDGQMDGQKDGNAIVSTALAMQALRQAHYKNLKVSIPRR